MPVIAGLVGIAEHITCSLSASITVSATIIYELCIINSHRLRPCTLYTPPVAPTDRMVRQMIQIVAFAEHRRACQCTCVLHLWYVSCLFRFPNASAIKQTLYFEYVAINHKQCCYNMPLMSSPSCIANIPSGVLHLQDSRHE